MACALLAQHPAPSEAEVRRALSGNLCRCTGYTQVLQAVALAVSEACGQPAPRRAWEQPGPPAGEER